MAVRVAFVVVIALVMGCGAKGTELREWRLDIAGGRQNIAVALPGNLRDQLPSGDLDYTLRTDLQLSAEQIGRPAAVVVDCFHAPLVLAANGTRVEAISGGAEGAWRFVIPAALTTSAKLALVFSVHRDHQAALGFGVAPRLVDDPRGDARSRAVASFNRYSAIVALCFIAILLVVYIALALIDGASPVYLALLAFLALITGTPLLELGVFHDVFGKHGTHVSALMGAGTLLAGLYFLHFALGLERLHRVFPIVLGSFALFVPLSAISQPATLAMVSVFLLLLVASTAYGMVRLVRRIHDPDYGLDAKLMVVAYSVSCVMILHVLYYGISGRSPIAGIHPSSATVALQGLVQALILARQHAARQRAVESANSELRRQVSERSRELADALAKLTQSSPAIATGRTIDNRYHVLDKLGAGGMGTVYAVERITDRKKLALKTLRGRGDPARMARFAREAQIAAGADHPQLLPVLDIGIAEGALYFVMPLADGSLETHRGRFGDRAWATPILAQLAAGLAALHARGVVHRDLKPANILFADGAVRIADFGLAQIAEHKSEPVDVALDDTVTGQHGRNELLTRRGDVFGTPAYMAPELEHGVHDAKPSSDIFAFGLIAYEMLRGVRAFAEPPLLLRLAGKPIPTPELADAPTWLVRCLDLDAAKRPTAAELVTA